MKKNDYLQLRINPELKEWVRAKAESENRTMANYIVNLIQTDKTKSEKTDN